MGRGSSNEINTAVPKPGQLRLNGRDERNEVVDLVRGCPQDQDRYPAISRTLLVRNSLIGCEKDIVAALFGGSKQLPVLHPLEARPFGAM